MLGETENQFSFTRAALSTWAGQKSKFLSVQFSLSVYQFQLSVSVILTNRGHLPGNFLQRGYEQLQMASDAQAARLQIAELRRMLIAMPTNVAAANILQFLDSKQDASTHISIS